MKRLHELTTEEIRDWRVERYLIGRKKYGDAHLQRYNLVDVMEELLDARNIINLLGDRLGKAPLTIRDGADRQVMDILASVTKLIKDVQTLDRWLPDEVCTDEQGGKRIWWSEQDDL